MLKSNLKAKGLSFGFKSIANGQKASVVNAKPQLIANSTAGKFTITGVVSKALNIEVGGYVVFLTNEAEVEAAIQERNAEILDLFEAEGLDIDNAEDVAKVKEALTTYAISKGIVIKDKKGEVVQVKDRVSKEERIAIVNAEWSYIDEETMDKLKIAAAEKGISEPTVDDLKAIAVEGFDPALVDKYTGSKTLTTSNVSTSKFGLPLYFTDSAIWKSMKSDLGEDANKFNRVFDIDLDDKFETVVSNGYEDVTVVALPLGDYTDVKAQAKGKAKDTEDKDNVTFVDQEVVENAEGAELFED